MEREGPHQSIMSLSKSAIFSREAELCCMEINSNSSRPLGPTQRLATTDKAKIQKSQGSKEVCASKHAQEVFPIQNVIIALFLE